MNANAIHGLMVEFLTADELLAATRRVRQAGYRAIDAYSPYPVEGLAAELGMRPTRIPAAVFVAAITGACIGFYMQYYSMGFDYPFNIGGRPLNSWPVFIPIAFELMVLVSSISAFVSMILLSGLPRLHHPVFSVPNFERASQDRFFLCIEAIDPKFDQAETAMLLASLAAHGEVIAVPCEPRRSQHG